MWCKPYNGFSMYWYRILRVLLFINIFTNLAAIADVGSSLPLPVTADVSLGIMLTVMIPILKGLFLYKLSCYSPTAHWYALAPVLYALIVAILIILSPINQLYPDASLSVLYAITLTNIFGEFIVFIPSFFYIRKRVSNNSCRLRSPEVHSASLKPLDSIAGKLTQCHTQADRDRVIAETFRGNVSPYTRQPIVCEADWQAYAAAYYAQKHTAQTPAETSAAAGGFVAAHSVAAVKPVAPMQAPAPEIAPTIPAPEVAPTIPAPEVAPFTPAQAPATFCRFCGNPLKMDSAFCDKCGKKLI